MRRQLAATVIAVAAVLSIGVPSVAHASAPAARAAEDVFYPEDQAPAAQPAPAQTSDAGKTDRETALARGSRQAADLMGFMPSLYQGKWYRAGVEKVRRCIMNRESNFNYRATNGTYHGAYQMSAALARGATWMMQKEVRKEMGAEGVAIVKALRKVTPNKWNRYWQDRAFWTVWRGGAGASHWRGGAHSC